MRAKLANPFKPRRRQLALVLLYTLFSKLESYKCANFALGAHLHHHGLRDKQDV